VSAAGDGTAEGRRGVDRRRAVLPVVTVVAVAFLLAALLLRGTCAPEEAGVGASGADVRLGTALAPSVRGAPRARAAPAGTRGDAGDAGAQRAAGVVAPRPPADDASGTAGQESVGTGIETRLDAPPAVTDAPNAIPVARFVPLPAEGRSWTPQDLAVAGDVAVVSGRDERGSAAPPAPVFVLERSGDAWRNACTLEAPRKSDADFGRAVGCGEGRIVVTGAANDRGESMFLTYLRDAAGAWDVGEQTVVGPRDTKVHGADLRGDRLVIAATAGKVGAVLVVFERRGAAWKETQRLEPSEPAFLPKSPDMWVSMDGDVVAVGASPWSDAVRVFRRGKDGFAAAEPVEGLSGRGVLCGGGTSLLREAPPFRLDVHGDDGWRRAAGTPRKTAARGRSPVAADGELAVVLSGSDTRPSSAGAVSFLVLERRAGEWRRARVARAAAPGSGGSPSGPLLAMSGRRVAVASGGDAAGPGVWFFEITDDDLARATPLGSDDAK
jgi:hypothetical protein